MCDSLRSRADLSAAANKTFSYLVNFHDNEFHALAVRAIGISEDELQTVVEELHKGGHIEVPENSIQDGAPQIMARIRYIKR